MQVQEYSMRRIVLITVSCCAFGTAHSGGYRVALQGQKALGMGHAGVAVAESAETVFFNPAGMTLLEDKASFSGGLTLVDASIEYYNADTNASAKTDTPLSTPINLYYSRKYSEQLSYGLGIYTPFGSTVEWPDDWAGSHLVNNITLSAIFVQPTVAWQFNDRYSVGLGLNYAIGGVEYNRNLGTALADAQGNRSEVTLEATGVDAFGANLGFIADINDKLKVGINYRSEILLKARGDSADFENVPASLASTFSDTQFDAEIPLPAELTLGMSYQFNDKTSMAMDLNFTDWSAYEELRIEFANDVPTSVNPRNYEDTTIFRLGVQHHRNERWTLRSGFYYDQSPVVSEYYSPDSPRNDNAAITFGATYNHTPRLAFDFSAFKLIYGEVTNTYNGFNESDGTATPFGGTYLSNAAGLGFGVSYNY